MTARIPFTILPARTFAKLTGSPDSALLRARDVTHVWEPLLTLGPPLDVMGGRTDDDSLPARPTSPEPRGVVRPLVSFVSIPPGVDGAIAYVLRNAVRHYPQPARFARETFVDPFSSGSMFDGWSRPVRIGWSPLDQRPPPISPPTTWLMKAGWRRVGLIDP